MTTSKTMNVFFSNDDQQIFPSISAVLSQLRLLAVIRDSLSGCELALKLHDTAAEGFELSSEMVEQICSRNDILIILVAPNILLSPGMLTSAAYQQLVAASKAKTIFMLSIYCEKITNADRLLPLLGGRGWIQTAFRYHLSSGKSVNDEAADAVDAVWRNLEKYFNN